VALARARAPGRLILVGGGAASARPEGGGTALTLAIRPTAVATVAPTPGRIELVSATTGARERIPAAARRRLGPPFLAEPGLGAAKAVAWRAGLAHARLAVACDLPAGAGLGGRAAAAVALVAAAAAARGEAPGRADLAEEAALALALVGGAEARLDCYASAFGGARLLDLAADGQVTVAPVRLRADAAAILERSLVVALPDRSEPSRQGDVAAAEQAAAAAMGPGAPTGSAEAAALARSAAEAIERADWDSFGAALERAAGLAWGDLGPVEGDRDLPLCALRAVGAWGAWPAGPAWPSALVVACPPARREEVRRALLARGWAPRAVRVDLDGATVERRAGREASG
jgi:galactokinase/mevalonate kinase-like predicted kinase